MQGVGGRLADAARAAVMALLLAVPATASAATNGPALQQLENRFRVSQQGTGSGVQGCRANALLTFAQERFPQLRRLEDFLGDHPLSASVALGKEVLGVADGRVVADRWVDVHIQVGLYRSTCR